MSQWRAHDEESPPMRGLASARGLRALALGTVVAVPVATWALGGAIGMRGQAAAGAVTLLACVGACSPDLRRVNWRTVLWGMGLQVAVALAILRFEVGGARPVFEAVSAAANGVRGFLELTNVGSQFVFGVLADESRMAEVFGPAYGLVVAFTTLSTIIFVSAFSRSSITSRSCRSSCAGWRKPWRG